MNLALVCPGRPTEDVEAEMRPVADAIRRRFGSRLSLLITGVPLDELIRPGRSGLRLWRRIVEEGVRLVPAPRKSSRAAR